MGITKFRVACRVFHWGCSLVFLAAARPIQILELQFLSAGFCYPTLRDHGIPCDSSRLNRVSRHAQRGKTGVMADRNKIEFRLFNWSSIVTFEYNPSRRGILFTEEKPIMPLWPLLKGRCRINTHVYEILERNTNDFPECLIEKTRAGDWRRVTLVRQVKPPTYVEPSVSVCVAAMGTHFFW